MEEVEAREVPQEDSAMDVGSFGRRGPVSKNGIKEFNQGIHEEVERAVQVRKFVNEIKLHQINDNNFISVDLFDAVPPHHVVHTDKGPNGKRHRHHGEVHLFSLLLPKYKTRRSRERIRFTQKDLPVSETRGTQQRILHL